MSGTVLSVVGAGLAGALFSRYQKDADDDDSQGPPQSFGKPGLKVKKEHSQGWAEDISIDSSEQTPYDEIDVSFNKESVHFLS
jgi:hypothetical protein